MPDTQTASSILIKQVPKARLLDVVDLWGFAFDLAQCAPVPGNELGREKMRSFIETGTSYVVGAFDDGKLAAVAANIDFDMHLGDKWVKAGGIAGVATYPEYRRKRLVKALLTDCLQKLHEDGVAIASLWPFNYPFYERMGWSVTDMRHEAELSLGLLRTVKGNSGAYKSAELDNLAPALAVHQRWSEQLNLSLRRDEYRWRLLLNDPRCRYKLFTHQDGYMLWNMGATTDNTFVVSEWCYLTDDAFRDGLALLSHMDSKVYQKVQVTLPELETLLRLAGPGCMGSTKVRPGMMSRVVNVEAVFEALPGKVKPDIEISDPLGVSGTVSENPVLEFGPGAFVQHITGFWKTPNQNFPESLYGTAAQYPPFSIERY
ncbi:MAG TPA: GNAT family N-acetyltransferase [Planktothrix sp.]